MSTEAKTADRPWYPAPTTLLLCGIPVSLLALWLWGESREEGAAFFAGVAAVLGVVALTVTGIGVVAQGVRVGLAWVDHDRGTLTARRTEGANAASPSQRP